MRFAFISNEGSGLPFWLRLKDEGNEVLVYVPDTPDSFVHRSTGKGLVDLAGSITEILAWGGAQPTVFVFDSSSEGDTAEWLRERGQLVVGGGKFCDRLEMDRDFGESVAEAVGVRAPETKKFSTISAAIAFLKGAGAQQPWYFKTDTYLNASATAGGDPEVLIRRLETYQKRFKDSVPNILQERIDGIDISTACWWNGREWIGPFEGTIENKKFLNGDKGGSTGCSMNAVWFYDGMPKIARELRFTALAEVFRRFNAPPGVYDINSIISDDDGLPYFLEWTPRFGYDAEPTAMRAIEGELGKFYHDLATGRVAEVPFRTDVAQMSVRMTVSPYPWEPVEHIKNEKRASATCVGVRVSGVDPKNLGELYGVDYPFMAYGLGLDEDGHLIIVEPMGIVGLVCADGTNLIEMNEEILEFAEDELDVPDLQYRTDAGEALQEHVAKIASAGYDVGPIEVK